MSSLRTGRSMFHRRLAGAWMLVLFVLLQAAPLAAMWSGPSLKGMECCRRNAQGHKCCKRHSTEPVMRSVATCGQGDCCAVPSPRFAVRFSVELPRSGNATPLAAAEPLETPEVIDRSTPGYSPRRYQRPPPSSLLAA